MHQYRHEYYSLTRRRGTAKDPASAGPSAVIYEQIFEKISTKELKPGDRLPSERELASQFGCGRPSVREALRMLQQDDLIDIDVGANGGATIKHSILESAVHPIQRLVGVGAISLSDLIVYRKYNDKACMELAMQNATSDDIKKLQQIIFDYEKYLSNPAKIHKIDKSFHEMFAKASHNNVCLLVAKIITSFSTDLFYNLTENQDPEEVNKVNKGAFENHRMITEQTRGRTVRSLVLFVSAYLTLTFTVTIFVIGL